MTVTGTASARGTDPTAGSGVTAATVGTVALGIGTGTGTGAGMGTGTVAGRGAAVAAGTALRTRSAIAVALTELTAVAAAPVLPVTAQAGALRPSRAHDVTSALAPSRCNV